MFLDWNGNLYFLNLNKEIEAQSYPISTLESHAAVLSEILKATDL